jgi:hypothetical protein
MKKVAFVMALLIAAVGAGGIVAPSMLIWIAQHVVTSGAFYAIATVRVAFGLILISVASDSRYPKTLRVLGVIILIVGITTALTALVAMESARAMIERWCEQGPWANRLAGVFILALGGFIARACAPARHAA